MTDLNALALAKMVLEYTTVRDEGDEAAGLATERFVTTHAVSCYTGMPNPIYGPLEVIADRPASPSATHEGKAIQILQSIQARRKAEETRAIILHVLGY